MKRTVFAVMVCVCCLLGIPKNVLADEAVQPVLEEPLMELIHLIQLTEIRMNRF